MFAAKRYNLTSFMHVKYYIPAEVMCSSYQNSGADSWTPTISFYTRWSPRSYYKCYH